LFANWFWLPMPVFYHPSLPQDKLRSIGTWDFTIEHELYLHIYVFIVPEFTLTKGSW